MKHLNFILTMGLSVMLVAVLLTGCKKDKKVSPDEEEKPAFSKEILNIIPQKIIDSLRLQGMVINEGTTPPNIEGSYYTGSANCFFDNSNFPRLGTWRVDYTYTLYNQNNTDLTLSIDYFAHPKSVDEATGKGSFVSGSGDNFSAFFLTEGVSLGVPYKMIYIISGRKTADGIVDWHDCLRMMEKGEDPTDKLIAVGGTRIFKEEDGIAGNDVSTDGKRSNSITIPISGKASAAGR